jgi:hypothetical protein
MRHLIESALKLTEATQEQLNQMRQHIQTLTQALEMYPDMADEIEPRLQRLRAFVQNDANTRTQGDPNDPRGDQTNPPSATPRDGGNPGGTTTAVDPDANDPRGPDQRGTPSENNPVATLTQMISTPGTAQTIQASETVAQQVQALVGQAGQNDQQLEDLLNRWLQWKSSPAQSNTATPGSALNTRAPAPDTMFASTDMSGKEMNKLNEASININGADASEVAEILRMMQLAGAPGAKTVDIDDINPGPKPCPICGKIHGPMPKPGGCGMSEPEGPAEPDMGDMIRMISADEQIATEEDDGGFGDATTEPDDTYMTSNAGDVSDMIPSGDDLHKEKDSYPATAGGDNPMNVESLKARLQKALAERQK